jgi:hypothetical protein
MSATAFPAGRAHAGERLRDVLLVVLIALASRALGLLLAAATRFGTNEGGRLGTDDFLQFFIGWDSGWYLRIVANGYAPFSLEDAQMSTTPHAFFPVYPLLVRSLVLATGLDARLAAVATSMVLFVAGAVLVYEYARGLGWRRETGLAAVLLLCCAPHSFVLSAVYAESTFLCLFAAAALALRRGAWLWAGVFGALLSATRPNGVLFAVFVLAWTVQEHGARVLLAPWRASGPMLALVVAPLGLIAYWWFCFLTTGDAFAQKTTVTHGWYWEIDWPWANFVRHFGATSLHRFWAWGSLLYFVATLPLLRARLWPEFAFCLASFVLVWTNVHPPSLLRYAVVLFPIYLGLARACEGRPLALALLAGGFAAINALLAVGFALHWPLAV